MSSLSCEYEKGCLFVCSAFEVPRDAGWSPETAADVVPSWGGGGGGFGDTATGSNWIPSQVFLEREEEFEIVMVPHVDLTLLSADDDEDNNNDDDDNDSVVVVGTGTSPRNNGMRPTTATGIIVVGSVGVVNTTTNDSGLRPCPTYLRHCVLVSWNFGGG